MNILWSATALMAGAFIGFAFGAVQRAALRKNEKLQRDGKLNNGWSVMPGSGMRVAYLLVILALIQFLCPMMFSNGTQWWVSGGVALGYGYMLTAQLRQKISGRSQP